MTLARPPVQVESEDNNNISQANVPTLALSAGHQTATMLGTISVGDGNGDFYGFGNLGYGTTISLGLVQPPSSGFPDVLGIYNSSGVLVTNSPLGGASLAYTIPAGQDGVYYARVTADATIPRLCGSTELTAILCGLTAETIMCGSKIPLRCDRPV